MKPRFLNSPGLRLHYLSTEVMANPVSHSYAIVVQRQVFISFNLRKLLSAGGAPTVEVIIIISRIKTFGYTSYFSLNSEFKYVPYV
jgi:hypothetical protein